MRKVAGEELYWVAERYVGVREVPGEDDHPLIQWWLSLCFDGNMRLHDEVPWCSAFLNGMAWELRLPRSKSAMARSWLRVGLPIELGDARPGDVVVLWRGTKNAATGHVALYGGQSGKVLHLLGGNQHNGVCVAEYPADRVVGVRRIT